MSELEIRDIVARAFKEDVRDGDVTTLATISKTSSMTAKFLVKADGVVAGFRVAELVFEEMDPELKVQWFVKEGSEVKKGTYIGSVSGATASIVTAERLALNLMQRMSGIATATHAMVKAVGSGHTKILDTRKTMPNLRVLDKLAHRIGGGTSHRAGLYDMVMIKDNHVSAAGGVKQAVEAVHAYLKETGRQVPIEVETRTFDEVKTVVALHKAGTKVDRIMLDNMVTVGDDGSIDCTRLEQALAIIDKTIPTEASGNVTLATVGTIAKTGVDYISSGSLTHSVTALDISLKIQV